MIFYSGFMLKNEKEFFNNFLSENDFTLSGFSYGAIKAFEMTLNSSSRIDTLQLFSPAFFQDKKESFKKLQLKMFDKDFQKYQEMFIENCFVPHPIKEKNIFFSTYCFHADKTDLIELLYYQWSVENIEKIINKGIIIEVYLSQDDKIIDYNKVKEFFLPYATVHTIKNGNHFLQTR
jgi:hypothetical protein